MSDLDELGEFGAAVVVIGEHGALSRAHLRRSVASTATLLRQLGPSVPVMLMLGGYDNDPREIWQIPEARDYVLNWLQHMLASEDTPAERFVNGAELREACRLAREGRESEIIVRPAGGMVS